MSTTTTSRRTEATFRVMKSLGRLLARQSLPIKLEDGTSPLIVVLAEDNIGEIIERLNLLGGMANLAVAYPDHYVIASIAGSAASEKLEESVEVHQLTNAAMLIAWLKSAPKNSAVFSLSKSGAQATDTHSGAIEEFDYAF